MGDLPMLRILRSSCRLDGEPALQMAESNDGTPMAQTSCIIELHPYVSHLAPGPQRLFSPVPRFHRQCRDEAAGNERVPATGREHPVGGGPLLPRVAPQSQLGGRWEASNATVAESQ